MRSVPALALALAACGGSPDAPVDGAPLDVARDARPTGRPASAPEQLARCEFATLVKTETEIVYDDPNGKTTDILVGVDGHTIGVSVVRAFAFPPGAPYPPADAAMLIQRKLQDILASSANVSAADRWEKQILSVLAWDDATAGVVAQVWETFEPAVRADTIVVVIATHGDDVFIYDE